MAPVVRRNLRFERRARGPITQLKGVSGLLEIRSGKVVQMILRAGLLTTREVTD